METRPKKILIIHILLLTLYLSLSFGHGIDCCLTFGYGLGDIVYLFPLWLITLVILAQIIFFKKKFTKSYLSSIVFGFVLLLFILQLVLNHGPECPC